MIVGSVRVDAEAGAVLARGDTYMIATLTVVSVRRPFLAGGLIFGAAFTGFVLAFGDLLWPEETFAILSGVVIALVAGFEVGHLKLLSRDLRGSEQSSVVFGRYASLNKVRHEIADAMSSLQAANGRGGS